PLLVNIRMAALARLRIHKELRWNTATMTCLDRTREKRAIRAIAFRRLRFRRHLRILNAVGIAPPDFPDTPGPDAHCESRQGKNRKAQDRTPGSSGQQEDEAKHSKADMRIEQTRKWTRSARPCQNNSKKRAGPGHDPSGRSRPGRNQK